jgi:hypothetical protein
VIRLVVGNGVRVNLVSNSVLYSAIAHFLIRDLPAEVEGPSPILDAMRMLASRPGLLDPLKLLEARREEIKLQRQFSDAVWSTVHPRTLAIQAELLAFLHDRLKVTLRDQGVSHDIIDACLAMPGNDDLTLLVKRATALSRRSRPRTGRTCCRATSGRTISWRRQRRRTGSNTPSVRTRSLPRRTRSGRCSPPLTRRRRRSGRRWRQRISRRRWPRWPAFVRRWMPSSPPCR